MTVDSDMPTKIPTNLWGRQQLSVGMTTQGFVGTLGLMAANDPKPKPTNPEFGQRLSAGMKKYGVRQKDIVAELKVDPETVRLWTKGERVPGDARMKRLAKMIGMKAADLRFGPDRPATLPQMQGEHVTDEDELALLEAYRGIKKEWAREALRRRAVELLEEFGEPGVKNPWKAKAGTQ